MGSRLIFSRKLLIVFTGLIFAIFCFQAASAQKKKKEIVIKVAANQNIRDIAKKYLDNPDLWVDILRANNISSAAELKAGMTLKIPVESITRATKELEKARSTIQTADKSGAKIFAPSTIDSAVALRNRAIEKRKSGDWDDCFILAKKSTAAANRAYKVCLSKQDVPGQAKLHYKLGSVQSRKPADAIWKGATKGDVLIERDKVRTLSRSYAEILFHDESRLKLEENSQALIQEMRVNLLENKNRSNVSLIEGDFTALLSGGRSMKGFELDIPGVETEIKSKNFRVGRNKQGSKFANYEGELGVKAAGEKVVLEKNQGTVVKVNQKPTKPKNLLAGVKLVSPENEAEVFDLATPLTWEKISGASQYEVQIAEDKCCEKIVSKSKRKGASLSKLPQLGAGIYFWRVSAYDNMGLAGPFSSPRSFVVVKDDVPPYLLLKSPLENAVVNQGSVSVAGEIEKGAGLIVNGEAASVSEEGTFSVNIPLKAGVNLITVAAKDKAGNQTKVERSVSFQALGALNIDFDPSLVRLAPNKFTVKNRAFTLSGRSQPGNVLTLNSRTGDFTAQAITDTEGAFQFSVTLKQLSAVFDLKVVSLAGDSASRQISIEVDDQPPKIILEGKVPPRTGEDKLSLKGRVEGGHKVFINGEERELTEERFSETVELAPGANHIKISASDLAGNSAESELDVFLDRTPPKYSRAKINPLVVKGGEQVTIHVYAQDESGLKKAAPFTVKVSDFTFNGFLRYVKSASRYEGVVSIPAGVGGKVVLQKVILQDALGNRKDYSF